MLSSGRRPAGARHLVDRGQPGALAIALGVPRPRLRPRSLHQVPLLLRPVEDLTAEESAARLLDGPLDIRAALAVVAAFPQRHGTPRGLCGPGMLR
jgi:hypothetical protein